MDLDDELVFKQTCSTLTDQSDSSDRFTHAIVNARCRECPRSVLQAETIVVSCALANFERTSFLGRRSVVPNSGDVTMSWKLRQTTTCFSTVLKTTTLECATVSENGWVIAKVRWFRLRQAMSRFFSSKNIVIMIYRSGSHRYVANADLWSKSLTRRCRRQHSASSHQSCISGRTRVQESVRNTNSLSESSRHITIASVLSVHHMLLCPILWLNIGRDRDWRIRWKVECESSINREFAPWRRSLLTSVEKRATSLTYVSQIAGRSEWSSGTRDDTVT